MLRKAVLTLVFTMPLVWASPARAGTVLFNPAGTGAGGAFAIDLLDPRPGNNDAVNGGGTALTTYALAHGGSIVGAPIESLFQANLGSADNSATPGVEYTNGGAGHFFTFTAGVPELVTAHSSTAGTDTVAFGFNPAGASPVPTATNFFYMYATTSGTDIVSAGGVPNDRSGICFTCGTLILSGVFVNVATFGNSYTVDTTLAPPGPPLDGFGADNYPGVTSEKGSGSFDSNIQVTFANAGYFPGLVPGGLLTWHVSTENKTPYSAVDPSACFSLTGLASCTYGGAGTANIGATNGEGKDVMLQSDANVAFPGVNAVIPEPGTLTLLGVGLLAAGRRRMKRNQN